MTRSGPRTYQVDFLTALFRDPLDPAYAQAAAVRRDSPPMPAWRRLGRKVVSIIVLTVIGFLFAVAYRQVVMDAPEREKVRAGLVQRILEQKVQTSDLALTAEALQEEVSVLRDAALSESEQAELRELEAATGLRKVSGDGLVVSLADGPDAAVNDLARIGDFDLQWVVNTLWYYGAEAISINDRRLTSLSTIRRGGGINVGDFVVISPYEISAVGPSDLYDKFSNSITARFYREMQQRPDRRLGFKITEQDDLVLPAAVLPDLLFAEVPSVTESPTPTPSGGGK